MRSRFYQHPRVRSITTGVAARRGNGVRSPSEPPPFGRAGATYASLTATCLMRVYSSIEYSDMSLP
jgi:hypothetical protein